MLAIAFALTGHPTRPAIRFAFRAGPIVILTRPAVGRHHWGQFVGQTVHATAIVELWEIGELFALGPVAILFWRRWLVNAVPFDGAGHGGAAKSQHAAA